MATTESNANRLHLSPEKDAYVKLSAGLGLGLPLVRSLVGRHGAANWYDARMRHFARAPIAATMQTHLAAEQVKYLRALSGLSKKCLVVDLDNTLWGGVVGEEGPLGIQLGATYPGSAFVEFQHRLLDLHTRGVLLAVASKNNPSDVDEVFQANTAMALTDRPATSRRNTSNSRLESAVCAGPD